MVMMTVASEESSEEEWVGLGIGVSLGCTPSHLGEDSKADEGRQQCVGEELHGSLSWKYK